MTRKASAKGISILLVAALLLAVFPVPLLAKEAPSAGPQDAVHDAAAWGAAVGQEISDDEEGTETEPPYVIGEDESVRESAFKQFRMSDGSFTAVSYGTDVHYKENGEWQEIDNTLTKEENGIVNAGSDVHYTFSTDANQLPGATVALDQYQVSFYGTKPEAKEVETNIDADKSQANSGAEAGPAEGFDDSWNDMQSVIESEPAQPDTQIRDSLKEN